MSEKNHGVRDGIIATVVGGIILWAIIPLIPTAWNKLLGLLIWMKYFMISRVQISTWLYILLFVLLANSCIRCVSNIILLCKTKPSVTKGIDKLPNPPQLNEANLFSEEEVLVLTLLTKMDGKSLELSEISRGISKNNIRTQHAIDLLKKRKLVTANFTNGFRGIVYDLTSLGRAEVVRRGIDTIFTKK
ncbi:MAG: hypothetical protein HQL22_09610 [Candidatus Omnitrophica bacterium]|nr:hypothetical protein [Candidatus Omnitrophota bacterium]